MKHIRAVVSNGVRLQTHQLSVTLLHADENPRAGRAPLKVQMEEENSSAWTEEETHWLIGVWGETESPFKSSSRARITQQVPLWQCYDVTRCKLRWRTLAPPHWRHCHSNLSGGSVTWPSLNRATTHLDTSTSSQTKSNQI